MTEAGWDPQQYERFKAQRTRPFFDLVGLVEARPGMRVIDLGCGTGELTAQMAERLGAAECLGIDTSPAMLEKSAAFASETVRFERARYEDLPTAPAWDLVFSNAALQFAGDGWREVFARARAGLAPGGQLAVQVPDNADHPAYRLASDLAGEAPFAEALGGWTRPYDPYRLEDLARALFDLGFEEQSVSLRIYAHVLPSRDHVLEWVKGGVLTAYRQKLPAELHEPFMARYVEGVPAALGDERPYFYAFRRIFVWGRLPA